MRKRNHFYAGLEISLEGDLDVLPIEGKEKEPDESSQSQVPFDYHEVGVVVIFFVLVGHSYPAVDGHSHQIKQNASFNRTAQARYNCRAPCLHLSEDHGDGPQHYEERNKKENCSRPVDAGGSLAVDRGHCEVKSENREVSPRVQPLFGGVGKPSFFLEQFQPAKESEVNQVDECPRHVHEESELDVLGVVACGSGDGSAGERLFLFEFDSHVVAVETGAHQQRYEEPQEVPYAEATKQTSGSFEFPQSPRELDGRFWMVLLDVWYHFQWQFSKIKWLFQWCLNGYDISLYGYH